MALVPKNLKPFIILLLAVITLVIIWLSPSSADEYDKLRTYPKPLICYEVNKNGVKARSPIILVWANFVKFDNKGRMVFKTLDGKVMTITESYICRH